MAASAPLPYKLAVLVFVQDSAGRHLLLKRAKAPNLGLWSPIGGKLETQLGESPFECAKRETREECGLVVQDADLHLFGLVAEKAYEGSGHWLLFLFQAKKPLDSVPPAGPEGSFEFFSREEVERLDLPGTDRSTLWPLYDRHAGGFVCLRAECAPNETLAVTVEQILPSGPTP